MIEENNKDEIIKVLYFFKISACSKTVDFNFWGNEMILI